MRKVYITDYDIDNNVAFDDEGNILPIEDYIDENGDPCLPEEAIAFNVKLDNVNFKTVYILGED